MHIFYKNMKFYPLLYFIFLLVLIYALLDFHTSRNTTGIKDLARGGGHAALFALLLVLGVYYAYTISGGRILKSYMKTALWLIAGWIGIVNLIQSSYTWSTAVHMGLCVLWILVYHFFSYYLRRWPTAWIQIQVCITIMFGFYVFSALYAAYAIQMRYEGIAVVNLSYGVLVFLPWIFLLAEKKLRRLGVGIVFLVVLISMKRGAIVVFPLMLSASLIVEAMVRKKRHGRPVLKIIFAMALLFAGFLIADQLSGGLLRERFLFEQLTYGSGRAVIYRSAIEEILQRSGLELLLGYGSGSSMQYLGISTHNEWLEFLFSFGALGVVFYAFLFFALARRLRQLITQSSPYAPAFSMAVVYMLVVGMFGGIYFVHSTLYIMAFFGVVEGLMSNNFRNAQRLVYSKNHYRSA